MLPLLDPCVLSRFHSDLDHYCASLLPQLTEGGGVSPGQPVLAPLIQQLGAWHANAIEYLTRCKAALQDNLKYLIHSVSRPLVSLHDKH